MDKRGQIYILVALIMSVIIFGMVGVTNRAEQESVKSQFEELSINYATESSKLINSLLDEPDSIPSAFKNFTLMFTSYSKTQNQQFELIYAFDYGNKIYLGNYLKNRILVCTIDDCTDYVAPLEGCYSNVPATITFDGLSLDVSMPPREVFGACETEIEYAGLIQTLYITINEVTYQFDIKKDSPEVMLVSWESKAQQRKVFTGGNMITQGTASVTTLSNYCRNKPVIDTSYCTDDRRAICGLIASEDECNVNSLERGGDCKWVPGLEACQLAL